MSVPKRRATEAGASAPDCRARRVKLKPRALPLADGTCDTDPPADVKIDFKKECAAKFERLLRNYMLSDNCQIKSRETWEECMQCIAAQETPELDHRNFKHARKLIAMEDDEVYLLHKGTKKRYVHGGQVFSILWEQFAEVQEVEAWSMKVEFVWKNVHDRFQNIPKRLIIGLCNIMTGKNLQGQADGAFACAWPGDLGGQADGAFACAWAGELGCGGRSLSEAVVPTSTDCEGLFRP
jgi:hypothetical protein